MRNIQAQNPPTEIERHYNIGGVLYIVKASTKEGATDDAKTKIRRLIQNDITRQATVTEK